MATLLGLESGTNHTKNLAPYATPFLATGTLATATDQVHTGTQSLKSNVTSTGGSAIANLNNCTITSAGSRQSYYVMVSTASPSTDTCFLLPGGGASADVLILGITTAGKLKAEGIGATAVTGSTVLTALTWYHLEIAFVLTSTSNWTYKVWLNGSLEITVSNAQGTLTGISVDHVALGILAAEGGFSSSAIMSVWFSDEWVDDGTTLDEPGDIRVCAEVASSNGTAVQFTTAIGDGTVTHLPIATTNGVSISTAALKTHEFNCAKVNTPAGATIQGVVGWIYQKIASTSNSPVTKIIVDGTGTTKTPANTTALYSQAISPNPTTYPAGTGTDIGMSGQYTTTAHLFSLFAAGIIVAYIPSAGGTGGGPITHGGNLTNGGALTHGGRLARRQARRRPVELLRRAA